MGNYQLHLISHVHWDPMWYLPYEHYRIRLIRLMKKLLKILDNDKEYHSFMFDGQVSALDDYLEICPDDTDRLKKHISSGRLIVGPWYIQPEEFMISGESHIRNLEYGRKRAKQLGGKAMDISYLCDMVGHIAQMPQIIKGFNIDTFVGWRGIIDQKTKKHSEILWEGSDGTEVLLKVMPQSYHSGAMPNTAEDFITHTKKLKDALIPYATTEYLYIVQGGDHTEPVENTVELIRAYNKAVGREELVQTTLKEHINAIKPYADKFDRYKGEHRSTYESLILTGILTTRMDIKLKSELLSATLERLVEPFCTIGDILDTEYPKEVIDFIWKKQLKNSFHDIIYGAHSDLITPDALNEYKRGQEAADWVVGDTLYDISTKIDTTGKDINVTLFNPVPWARKDVTAEFEVFFEEESFKTEFFAIDEKGEKLACQVCGAREMNKLEGFSGNMWSDSGARWGHMYTLAVKLPYLPALGYTNISLKRAVENEDLGGIKDEYMAVISEAFKKSDIRTNYNTMENEHLFVKFSENGTLSVYDKNTGKNYENLHIFDDSGDFGDHYNFSPPVENNKITTIGQNANISLVEEGPLKAVFKIEYNWRLPKCAEGKLRRSSEMVENRIVTYVTMKSQTKTLEFKTIVDNQSKDHRLSLMFPTGINVDSVKSGGHFDVNDRSVMREDFRWHLENPVNTHPHRLYVDLSDNLGGVTFISRGLPAYSADGDGNLSIPLLRCINQLSKLLPERTYINAGPWIPTPMAQEIGEHSFEYALSFHAGSLEDAEGYKQADEFYVPIKWMQGDAHTGSLPESMSFLEIEGKDIMYSAFYKSENAYILRLYNASEDERRCTVKLFKDIKSAQYIKLNEEFIKNAEISNGKVILRFKKREIVTIKIEL